MDAFSTAAVVGAVRVATDIDGIGLLLAAAVASGLVRGFAGFGTALIFLPVAARFLDPFAAITVLVSMDLIGPVPNLPRAWRDAARRDLFFLGVGLAVGLPVGLSVLVLIAPEVFRYLASFTSLGMLVLLILGFGYRGEIGRGLVTLIGVLSGILGGVAGIPGPPVILLYMAGARNVAAIRATILLFLFLADIGYLGLLWGMGRMTLDALALGFLLCAPFLLANVAGAWMFRPDQATLYRWIAYAIIGASALVGLPLWD